MTYEQILTTATLVFKQVVFEEIKNNYEDVSSFDLAELDSILTQHEVHPCLHDCLYEIVERLSPEQLITLNQELDNELDSTHVDTTDMFESVDVSDVRRTVLGLKMVEYLRENIFSEIINLLEETQEKTKNFFFQEIGQNLY